MLKLARMLLEGDVVKLSSLNAKLFDDAARQGMNPNLVSAMREAHQTFMQYASPKEIEILMQSMHTEVEQLLRELDSEHR